jgi:hypothetical protein
MAAASPEARDDPIPFLPDKHVVQQATVFWSIEGSSR